MNKQILKDTIQQLFAGNKGLLAMDESIETCNKRFAAAGIPQTVEMRRSYRELIVTTPGLNESIGGAILFDETIRQQTNKGTPMAGVLKKAGIIPGIKLDLHAKPMAGFPGEKVTEGLDGLRERFAEYAKMGAGFAKWRAVITIGGDKLPSVACYKANAHGLARYAALAQEAGIVPVVEPEVLLDGNHSIERCYAVTADTLDVLFAALKNQDVLLEGVILKASMVLSGKDAPNRAGVQEVAEQTLKCLKEHVPANLGGVVFLSGGQSEEEATAHLNAMNKLGGAPWPLTFSYSRAIQNPVLEIWAKGKKDEALKAYIHRGQANALAAQGKWSEDFEKNRPY